MLYVYDDKEKLPSDKKFIHDVEAWFIMPSNSSREVDLILQDIEKGKYYNKYMFIDRFGVNLYCDFLSTGTKAAILVVSRDDYVVNMIEAGKNVFECLVKYNMSGNIFVSDITDIAYVSCYDSVVDIIYDGRKFCSAYELNRWLKDGRFYENRESQYSNRE